MGQGEGREGLGDGGGKGRDGEQWGGGEELGITACHCFTLAICLNAHVQGLNFVAGVLLMFMEEEDAFYCLCTVVEDILPGHYATDMLATQV